MSYNDANRLESITENSQVIAGYTYNAAGQRKTKVTPAGTTIYHYDLGGNLISETTSAGSAIKDYVWQGNEPIAQIDVASTEQITYLHTDHLMTARLGTNTGGTITWRWESDAFGQTAPEEDVDGNTINTSVNLRFPGQYFDSESGLHYNLTRDYNPKTGSYIQSDSIGLRGGLNTYLYANANPVNYYDPNGESATAAALPIAGGAAAADGPFPFGDVVGLGILGAALLFDIIHEGTEGDSRAIPQPKKPSCGCTCNCRADANDNIRGNIKPGDKTFVIASATDVNCPKAKKQAKKAAAKALGKQPKHTDCLCAGK